MKHYKILSFNNYHQKYVSAENCRLAENLANVNVKCFKGACSTRKLLDFFYRMAFNMEGASPPVFEQIFRNARFAQGGNALFEGKVAGSPRPQVRNTD